MSWFGNKRKKRWENNPWKKNWRKDYRKKITYSKKPKYMGGGFTQYTSYHKTPPYGWKEMGKDVAIGSLPGFAGAVVKAGLKKWYNKNTEIKSHEVNIVDATPYDAGAGSPVWVPSFLYWGIELTRIKGGSTNRTRHGTSIRLVKHILVNYDVSMTTEGRGFNIWIVMDTRANAITPVNSTYNISGPLDNSLIVQTLFDTEDMQKEAAGGTGTIKSFNTIRPFLNTYYAGRYQILGHHRFIATGYIKNRRGKFVIPINQKLLYATATDALATPTNCSIFVAMSSDERTDGYCKCNVMARLRFVDD